MVWRQRSECSEELAQSRGGGPLWGSRVVAGTVPETQCVSSWGEV